jgi:hypothetical protein
MIVSPAGLSKPFLLTPRTGDRFRDVELLGDEANLNGALAGNDVMETSVGRNLEKMLQLAPIRRALRAEHGLLAVDASPVVEGQNLRIPSAKVFLNGDSFTLSGIESDGSQLVNLAGLQAGDYAVVIESWKALIGPTSYGQATEPSQFLGVTDTVNKPTSLTLYPSGNIDILNGPSDLPLVTHTVITQKFLQRQYRVRIIPDRDLLGYTSDVIPLIPVYPDLPNGAQVRSASYTLVGDGLYEANLPQMPSSYLQAFDRHIDAFKLCRVTVGVTGLTLHTRTLLDQTETTAQILPARRTLAIATALSIADLVARVVSLEASRGNYTLKTQEPFGIADRDSGGSALPQNIPFPAGIGGINFSHDLVSYPSRLIPNFTGPLTVTASAVFAGSVQGGIRGLRLLVNSQPSGFAANTPTVSGERAEVSLSASLNVVAGQIIEIEAYQTSGAILQIINATLAFSR